MEKANLNGVRLGVDMGGTLTKFIVLDNGKKVYEQSLPTPKTSCEDIIKFIVEKYEELKNEFNIERMGVGVPCVVRNGIVDADNLPIHNVPLCDALKEYISIPLTVDNDANCAALAEARLGNTKYDNLVMITIGTGIGGGVVLDGEIRRGRGGMGEICHMSIDATVGEMCSCGHRGCFEGLASTTALVRKAENAARANEGSYLNELYRKEGKLDGKLVFKALKQGCPVAIGMFSEYLDKLVLGIKNIVYIFDPDAVVLAGGITKDGDMFIDELRKRVGTDVPIVISTLQNQAGAYGAAML